MTEKTNVIIRSLTHVTPYFLILPHCGFYSFISCAYILICLMFIFIHILCVYLDMYLFFIFIHILCVYVSILHSASHHSINKEKLCVDKNKWIYEVKENKEMQTKHREKIMRKRQKNVPNFLKMIKLGTFFFPPLKVFSWFLSVQGLIKVNTRR